MRSAGSSGVHVKHATISQRVGFAQFSCCFNVMSDDLPRDEIKSVACKKRVASH